MKCCEYSTRGSYSQHIFCVTYDLAQKDKVFVRGKPFQLSVMQHSSLFVPPVSYRENEVL